MAEQTQPTQQQSATMDSVLILREVDRLDRRIDVVEQRVATIDTVGTRGMDGLKVQLSELSKDVTALDTTFGAFRKDLRSARWTLGLAYVGGLIPLYAFVVEQFVGGK